MIRLPKVLLDLPDAEEPVDDDTHPPGEGGLRGLQQQLGYAFERPALLRVALTLGSWANEHRGAGWPSNACLEFLGDAVLGLLTADALWRRFPDLAEGELTRLRAALVSESSLAAAAQEQQLGEWLYLGRGDLKRGGRDHPSTLADAVEAVLGAVFLDAREAGRSPLEAAAVVYGRLLGPRVATLAPHHGVDPKSRLQHWAQGRFRVTPTYARVGEPPPPDDPRWTAQVELRFSDGRVEVLGQGQGRSLKQAERAAARQALARIEGDD
ncbi:ribonuclease III [Paraliomyxa miuraensis]|uniref:ribonuclease III n=1 Tax=Paraliomyxa miuraensis TaxID=376150 RepID=UPI00224D50A7|nr:ribonuclease III [Paraliomyxa miuraensis]MCX4245662.1 ribonuclease III [Paraliomyxa miuraensis]